MTGETEPIMAHTTSSNHEYISRDVGSGLCKLLVYLFKILTLLTRNFIIRDIPVRRTKL